MSFGPKKTTQTTTTDLSPEQRALINPAVAAGQKYAANPPKLPSYSQITPFNANQIAAQNTLLGSVLGQQQVTGAAAGANQFLLSPDILNPNSNPALQATIDAATRPITENLLESVLPSIRGSAVSSGAYGGSRQGIAEGLGVGRAASAIGDTAAKISTAGYGQGLDAMTKGLALMPSTLQAMLQPGLTQGSVGDVQAKREQAILSEKAFKEMYAQIAPWLAAKDVASVGAGIPGGTTTATATTPGASPLQTALGIGSLAAGFMAGGPAGAAALSPGALMAIFGGGNNVAGLF